MTDDKRELENTEDHGAGAFGSARGEGSGSSSLDGASNSRGVDGEQSGSAFGGFGSARTETVYGAEIKPEHLDELPDIENVEDYVDGKHVYDEETAGALVALMFAKEHQDDLAQYTPPTERESASAAAPRESSPSALSMFMMDGEGETPKKKSKLLLIFGALFAVVLTLVIIAYSMSGPRADSALPESYASDYEYTTNEDGSAILTKYKGSGGSVRIPEQIGGFKVTSIENYAFSGNDSIVEVYIPPSIREVGQFAFSNCRSLYSVTLAKGVETIAANAFFGCTNLQMIGLPDGLKTIGSYAFQDCYSLTGVTIPEGVESIEYGAFYNCTGLVHVVVPTTLRSINRAAFEGCSSLTDVYISDLAAWFGISFRGIDANPMENASNLYLNGTQITDIVIPESVTRIGDYALKGLESMTSLTLHGGISSIGTHAFSGCIGLETVFIPDSVSNIGSSAFAGNPYLFIFTSLTYQPSGWNSGWSGVASVEWGKESPSDASDFYYTDLGETIRIDGYKGSSAQVYIPAAILLKPVVEIADSAFSRNSDITTVVIPDSVTRIGTHAFYGCTSISTLTIGSGVEEISAGAFYECYGLTSVSLPESLDSLGTYAFSRCTKLARVIIPSGLSAIPEGAFEGCSMLTEVNIPSSVNTISSMAFQNCSSLARIEIPSTVAYMGYMAFRGCSSLTIYYEGASAESADWDRSWNFDNRPVVLNYIFPSSASDFEYAKANGEVTVTGYVGNSAKVRIPDVIDGRPVTAIGEEAFSNNSSLTDVIIPDSVITIGNNAFFNCSSLVNVELGLGVVTLGSHAFYGCPSLTNIVIPAATATIGHNAFSYCVNLEAVELSEGLLEIGNQAFMRCDKLASIALPDGLMSIGSSAFSECGTLTEIIIPDSVTGIDGYAFYDSNSLTIYCEAESQPDGWDSDWNNSSCPVVWDYYPDVPISDFEYTESGNEVIITGYNGSEKRLRIPDTIEGNPVVRIEDSALEGNEILTAVSLPDSLTYIGQYAFRNCTSLASITIPEKVASIGREAFAGCTNVKSLRFNAINCLDLEYQNVFGGIGTDCDGAVLYIGENVTRIPNGAFGSYMTGSELKYGIQSVIFEGDACAEIGWAAFYECAMLDEIVIPDSVTSIGDYAFSGCTSLTSIVIPDSVTEIGEGVFSGCSSLEYSEYGNAYYLGNDGNPYLILEKAVSTSITSCEVNNQARIINSFAFYDCSKLASVTIGNGVTSIGNSAFTNCSSLSGMVIPDSVTSIGDYAFSYCSNLASVTIGSGVTSIGEWAFYDCYNLTIYCEAESQPAGWDANWNFSNCPVVWGYTLPSPVSDFEYYEANGGITIYKYIGTDSEVVIPSTIEDKPVTAIYDEAFFNMETLSRVVIPDTVTSIGAEAFARCTSLVDINLPTSLLSIGERAFSYCSAIVRPELPECLESIGDQAFLYCSSLYDVIVPSSVTYVGDRAFQECGYLTLYCEAESQPAGWHADWNYDGCDVVWGYNPSPASDFEYSESNGAITITGYKGSSQDVVIPVLIDGKRVVGIADYAFYSSSFTSIVIPDSITSIGMFAFGLCSLTSVVIPDSVTTVGSFAFEHCLSLTIFCEAASKPEGWNADWNSSSCPVTWGYDPNAHI